MANTELPTRLDTVDHDELKGAVLSFQFAQKTLERAQAAFIKSYTVLEYVDAKLGKRYALDGKERSVLADGTIGPAPEKKEGADAPV